MNRRLPLAGVALGLAAGCLGRAAPRAGAGGGDALITLYRDGALIEERVPVALDGAGRGTIALTTTAIARDGLEVEGVDAAVTTWSWTQPHAGDAVVARIGARTVAGRRLGVEPDGRVAVATADGVVIASAAQLEGPTPAIAVTSPARDRTITVAIRYRTPALSWAAGYTLVDEGAGRGRLHGALRLDNRTGRRWRRADVGLLDAPLPTEPGAALPRDRAILPVGRALAIGPGPQRLDLGLTNRAIPLQPILVYDPVGTRLDGLGMRPNDDPRFGVERWSPQVEVSVSLALAQVSAAPLPSGPIRMFGLDADGQLAWRGEGQLLPPADGAARTVAIAIGRSTEVTGRRTQSMFELDHARERLIEEYTLEFDNAGAQAVTLEAREHMYRGRCWQLVYFSTADIGKQGEQLVSLRTVVPARGQAKIVYRVSYKWNIDLCKSQS
ncbi:MAG: hypothetical protein IPL61_33540 [Myxococcales bacterium]|nr:hypothetical protein [Myxococcales bacterium]